MKTLLSQQHGMKKADWKQNGQLVQTGPKIFCNTLSSAFIFLFALLSPLSLGPETSGSIVGSSIFL